MYIIEYSPKGLAYSDFEVRRIAKEFITINKRCEDDTEPPFRNDCRLHTSSEIVVDAIRLLIVQGIAKCKYIQMVFNGKTYQFDENGALINEKGEKDWPEGFLDTSSNIARDIISERCRRRKK